MRLPAIYAHNYYCIYNTIMIITRRACVCVFVFVWPGAAVRLPQQLCTIIICGTIIICDIIQQFPRVNRGVRNAPFLCRRPGRSRSAPAGNIFIINILIIIVLYTIIIM